MDAAGRDVVVVETVGVGQSEADVAELADVRVAVWMPGAGDEIQAAKAGPLEAADIVVVNKADLPGAAATKAGLENAASYRADGAPRVLLTVATDGVGVAELADAVAGCDGAAQRRRGGASRRLRRQIVGAVGDLARERADRHPALAELGDAVRAGETDIDAAARRLLAALARADS